MTMFHVHFNVADMDGKAVLIFLKPESPQRNSRIHAWRVLTGREGSIESFHYGQAIEVNVTSMDSKLKTPLTSNTASILPGELYEAVSIHGRSLALRKSSKSMALDKLSPKQCGVINTVIPPTEFDCHWFVDGLPVITMPHVDMNMAVGFEYLRELYFMVAIPPVAGQTYSVRDFSHMTQYAVPAGAQIVDIDLSYRNDLWTFEFSSNG